MKTQYTLRFLTDPGHGWISAPRKLVNELGIAKQITAWSYQKGGSVYLEEDCDASLFMETAGKAGITITFITRYHEDNYVRNMEAYVPRSYES